MLTWIIGLPFAALLVGITVVRLMRHVRQIDDARSRLAPPTIEFERRKPSDDFHDQTWLPLCASVAGAAISRLERPLTQRERRTVWRARSPLVLEVALKEIQVAGDAQAVAQTLANLPAGMDRPDPTGWCDAG